MHILWFFARWCLFMLIWGMLCSAATVTGIQIGVEWDNTSIFVALLRCSSQLLYTFAPKIWHCWFPGHPLFPLWLFPVEHQWFPDRRYQAQRTHRKAMTQQDHSSRAHEEVMSDAGLDEHEFCSLGGSYLGGHKTDTKYADFGMMWMIDNDFYYWISLVINGYIKYIMLYILCYIMLYYDMNSDMVTHGDGKPNGKYYVILCYIMLYVIWGSIV